MICKCDCGKIKELRSDTFRTTTNRPTTVSCGCYVKTRKGPSYIDDRTKTKLYHVWYGILQRCNNPKSTPYKYYGGRGIKCLFSDWESFRDWSLANGYKEGLSIDRINTNGHYEPDNCRWVTSDIQQANRNKQCNYLKIYIDGNEQTLAEICRKINWEYHNAYYHLHKHPDKFAQSVTTMAQASTVTIGTLPEAGGTEKSAKR